MYFTRRARWGSLAFVLSLFACLALLSVHHEMVLVSKQGSHEGMLALCRTR
jgi:hypothetical protein